jgi:hypothetical protein
MTVKHANVVEIVRGVLEGLSLEKQDLFDPECGRFIHCISNHSSIAINSMVLGILSIIRSIVSTIERFNY